MSGAIMRERGIGFGARYMCTVAFLSTHLVVLYSSLAKDSNASLPKDSNVIACSISSHGSFYSTACPFKCNATG